MWRLWHEAGTGNRRYGKFYAQFLRIYQPYNPSSRIDALIVLYQALFDRAVEGGEQFRIAHIVGGQLVGRFGFLVIGYTDFILLQGDGLTSQQSFVARSTCAAAVS